LSLSPKEVTPMPDNTPLSALSRHLFRAGAALPFLRAPIEGLARVSDDEVKSLATDGVHVFCGTECAPEWPVVAHLLMHCLFRHPVAPAGAVGPLWDLACDISAEYLRGEFFPSGEANLTRREIAEALPDSVDPRLAGAVYRSLMDLFADELEPLYARFRRDDHRYWYTPPPCFCDEARNPAKVRTEGGRGEGGAAATYARRLEEALERHWPSPEALPGGAARTGRYGLAPGSREEKLLLRAEGKYDFSRYLRRFSTTREELRLDLDSFDYIPYYYGFRRYGNLPLIEPLEVTESFKEMFLVVIQLGAILAVPILFWNKLWPFTKKKSEGERRRVYSLWLKVIVGAVPAAIIGVLLDDILDTYLYNYVVVSIALVVYGIAFILVEKFKRKRGFRVESVYDITYVDALKIGSFQILSLIPGTSRSGSTILGGMMCGVSRTASSEFSFFMAIPIMLGASGLKILKFILEGFTATGGEIALLLVGIVVSFLVSLLAIKILMDFVKKHDFTIFGIYRIALGVIVLGYFIIKTLVS